MQVQFYLTPVLPYIMKVEEMVQAIEPGIKIYLDKFRVFQKGNQSEKIFQWIKKEYPMYEEAYYEILYEGNEEYYADLMHKYKDCKRITFMSELWDE